MSLSTFLKEQILCLSKGPCTNYVYNRGGGVAHSTLLNTNCYLSSKSVYKGEREGHKYSNFVYVVCTCPLITPTYSCNFLKKRNF